MNINSPYPSPVRVFKDAIENGDDLPSMAWDVTKELGEQLPVVGGGLRYGRGITGAAPDTIQKILEGSRPVEEGAKLLGIPGAAQTGKYLRGKKYGKSDLEAALGTKYEKKKKSGPPKRPRRPTWRSRRNALRP